jgi:ubiquinone/menaquinone biosynthesis methyltransferase
MKRLFSDIAGKYDRMNRIMSLGLDVLWRNLSIADVVLPENARILDLACGTGDFTAVLARRWPDARIIGVDLTAAMLEVAKDKVSSPNVVFSIVDAHDLKEFADGGFDLIVCSFGFRNFPDKIKALSECFRVLAPGGRLIVLELFRPKSAWLGRMVNLWLICVAWLFAGKSKSEYRYLRKSVAGTVSADAFSSMATAVLFRKERERFFPPAATCIVFSKCNSRFVLG